MRNILLVASILAVGYFLAPSVLANIPQTHEIVGSIENKLSNNQPQVQSSQLQQEQSPYGQKQTQYYIQEFRSSNLYPNLLDCSDSQLIHLLVLFHNMYPNDQLTVTGNQYGSYLEDFNLGITESANLQNLFETYHC